MSDSERSGNRANEHSANEPNLRVTAHRGGGDVPLAPENPGLETYTDTTEYLTPNTESTAALMSEGGNIVPKVEIIDPGLTMVRALNPPRREEKYRVYAFRWYVLVCVSLINFSNAYAWIEFAPVANIVDSLYGDGASNWFSQIFLLAAVPVAIFAMWSNRRFGLRSSFLVSGWLNAIGGIFRACSLAPGLSQTGRYGLVLTGQIFGASAYPFLMFMPAKTSSEWFGDNQRTLATTIMTLSNPLGVLLANLLNPNIIHHVSDIYLLHIISNVFSWTPCLLATFGIRNSEPPTPPSASADDDSPGFGASLMKLFKSKNFIVIMICLGSGIAMFNTVYTFMQQVLCPKGYSNEFAGICSSLMVVFGTIGSASVAVFVDKTKLYVESWKIAFCFAVLSGIAYVVTTMYDGIAPAIAVACCLFGFFGIAAYPLGMEIAAICTFPVSATISSGFVVLAGQIISVMLMMMLGLLAGPLPPAEYSVEVCSLDAVGVKAKDMTIPMLAFASIATLVVLILVGFFHPKMKRLRRDDTKLKEVKGSGEPKVVELETLVKTAADPVV